MSYIQISEDDFELQFKPVENPDPNQGDYHFDVCNKHDKGFLQFIASNYPSHIWTRIDGDDGNICIINGWHIVNRIDYIVTEVPWLTQHEYEVIDYLQFH